MMVGRQAPPSLTKNKYGTMFFLRSWRRVVVKAVIQEAAALTSLVLFAGMIAIWSQVLGNL
jgi:hypothetical protein